MILVTVTEWDPFGNQIVSCIGSVHITILCSTFHVILFYFHSQDHFPEKYSVKLSVCQLHRIPGSCLPASPCYMPEADLCRWSKGSSDHRIHGRICRGSVPPYPDFFSWHDAASGGEGVVDLHETEFHRTPQDQLFAEPGQMHHRYSAAVDEFNGEISVGYGIHSIGKNACKAKFFCQKITVCIVGRSCQCSTPQRESVYAF